MVAETQLIVASGWQEKTFGTRRPCLLWHHHWVRHVAASADEIVWFGGLWGRAHDSKGTSCPSLFRKAGTWCYLSQLLSSKDTRLQQLKFWQHCVVFFWNVTLCERLWQISECFFSECFLPKKTLHITRWGINNKSNLATEHYERWMPGSSLFGNTVTLVTMLHGSTCDATVFLHGHEMKNLHSWRELLPL